MATSNDIPTELALEIGDDFEPDRFVAACRAFFALTDALAEAPDGDRVSWRVTVHSGSNIVALSPAGDSAGSAAKAAIERIRDGAGALVRGELTSPLLTERAIHHAKRLSDLTAGGPMRLWLFRSPIDFGPKVAEFIRAEDAGSYHDYGTLEGTLRAISDRDGGLEIRIHDALWEGAIPCRIAEDKVDEVLAAFRCRVEVSGRIHYNRSGRPLSIRMESLSTLPDDSALPTAEQVRGLLAENA